MRKTRSVRWLFLLSGEEGATEQWKSVETLDLTPALLRGGGESSAVLVETHATGLARHASALSEEIASEVDAGRSLRSYENCHNYRTPLFPRPAKRT
jgi:hypothetical protein